ncbi:MAG: DUF4373 domain-containing protein [Polaribacter sp.]
MARPQKNKVEYFPHPVTHGKKMSYMEKKYGNDGYAVWFKILEELGNTDFHYLNLSDEIQIMFLSDRCLVSEERLLDIISDLIKLKEFDLSLWNDNNILFSPKYVDSIKDAYAKRTNECINEKSILLLLESLGVRKPLKSKHKPNKCDSEGVIKPQTILEETKVYKTIEERKQEFYNSLRPYLEIYDKLMLKEFYEYWTEHGERDRKFRKEKEKSFNTELRLKTWLKRSKQFKENIKGTTPNTEDDNR